MSPRPLLAAAPALLVALLAALALTLAVAPPVAAVEDDAEAAEEPPPDIEELCREGTIAEEFCPERYEQPALFQFILYPLLGVGLLVVTLIVLLYLVWQPRFARERERQD
ncbi:MAG: hypothetical protein ACQETV_06040 [Actinomycetota bacterium]